MVIVVTIPFPGLHFGVGYAKQADLLMIFMRRGWSVG